MNTMREFRLFGALREYGSPDSMISIEIPAAISIAELRTHLASVIGAQKGDHARSLVLDSAIADERRLLTDQDTLPETGTFSLLPPVCGG
ncbi:MAG: hypothetical protein A2X94_07285 [Bdellovibrionales bacterium GWB1_55_8]|nr:MAG: hypothetical protein A2X94_07285 [Bdellovibrionales bacterium GWB1_55_8]